MRFPANCLVVALIAAAAGCSVHCMRNRSGRRHWFWRDGNGRAFEFYRKGASRLSYLQLSVYLGEVRRAPALDAVTRDGINDDAVNRFR